MGVKEDKGIPGLGDIITLEQAYFKFDSEISVIVDGLSILVLRLVTIVQLCLFLGLPGLPFSAELLRPWV